MRSAWVPDLDEAKGPLYWRIAAALARDVRSGRLGVGEQLPTHRALADTLGVTVNTVTKAYAEAEKNGLVVSRTGRGTFVKGFPEEMANGAAPPREMINLSANVTSSSAFNPVFNRLLGALSRRGSLHGLLDYHPHPGLDRHRYAGARWIARRGVEATPDRVIVCTGAQEGLLAVFSAIARPRDTVLTEKLNYAGVRYIADTLHLNVRGVEFDAEGMIPEALEAACQANRVAAILCNPTNHNPTTAVASLERRKAIVEIAGRAGALLVEDDIFGHLSGHDVPPLAALAPDRSVYVCGTSKSIAAGLRVGYLLPPAALVSRVIDSLQTMHWSSPALMGEIATLLIEEGHADEFVTWHRREAIARQELARRILGLDKGNSVPGYHLWVPLPEGRRTAHFVSELRRQGVLVAPSDQFAVDRSPVPDAVRLALGSITDREHLEKGLKLTAGCLRDDTRLPVEVE